MSKTDTDKSTQLDSLWQDLAQSISDGAHERAFKSADAILGLQPKDEDAYRAKLAALLQLSEWEKALQLISKPTGAGGSSQFEKAYCLYRMGRIDEALTTVSSLLPGGAGAAADGGRHTLQALELAAQLQYRLGRSKECIQLYDTLFQQHKADALDLKTNVLAAYVAAGLSKEVPDLMAAMKISPKSSFEVGYNKACGLVEMGDFAAAELELKLAIKQGQETLFEEELTEQEVEEELAPLTVQLAYALGRLGRTAEAQELHDKVMRIGGGSIEDLGAEPTRALAANNTFVDGGRIDSLPSHKKSVAGAAKKLEAMLADASKPGSLRLAKTLEARLSYPQCRLLHLNRGLAYLLAGRLPAAKEVAAAVAAEDSRQQLQQHVQVLPHWTGAHLLPLLQAAIASKDGKAQEADALLESAASSQGYAPFSVVHLLLAQTQLALEAGDAGKATEVLAKAAAVAQEAGAAAGLGARAGSPALLATLVALHQRLGDHGRVEALLEGMLATWEASPDHLLSTTGVAWCLEGLADLKLKLGKVQEAGAALQQLQNLGADSAPVLKLNARLLRALAAGADPSLPASLAQGLPSLAAEMRGIDVHALEEHTLLSARRAGGDAEAAPQAAAEASRQKRGADSMEVDGTGAEEEKKRVKKKRNHKKKPRLPKGYDPSQPNGGLPPPDPERWLPKWERSDFKKKKKKSSARDRETKGGGAQGAGKVDDSLDRTKHEGSKAKQAPPKPQLPAGKSKKGKR